MTALLVVGVVLVIACLVGLAAGRFVRNGEAIPVPPGMDDGWSQDLDDVA